MKTFTGLLFAALFSVGAFALEINNPSGGESVISDKSGKGGEYVKINSGEDGYTTGTITGSVDETFVTDNFQAGAVVLTSTLETGDALTIVEGSDPGSIGATKVSIWKDSASDTVYIKNGKAAGGQVQLALKNNGDIDVEGAVSANSFTGLDDMSEQASNNVTITGGSITGIAGELISINVKHEVSFNAQVTFNQRVHFETGLGSITLNAFSTVNVADNYVPKYDAATGRVDWEADGGGAGAGNSTIVTQTVQFQIPGQWAGSVSQNLLRDYALMGYEWNMGAARLVNVKVWVTDEDSGAVEPDAVLLKNGSPAASVNVSGAANAWVTTTNFASATITFADGDDLEVGSNAGGTNNDSKNLSMQLTVTMNAHAP